MDIYFLMKVRHRYVSETTRQGTSLRSVERTRSIHFLMTDLRCEIISCHSRWTFNETLTLSAFKIWHKNIKLFCIDVYNESYWRLDVVFFNQNIFSSAMINRDNYPYVFAISEVTPAILWRRYELLRELGRSYLATHVNVSSRVNRTKMRTLVSIEVTWTVTQKCLHISPFSHVAAIRWRNVYRRAGVHNDKLRISLFNYRDRQYKISCWNKLNLDNRQESLIYI